MQQQCFLNPLGVPRPFCLDNQAALKERPGILSY